MSAPSLRALLLDEDGLTEAGIEAMVSRFLAQVKDGTWGEQGWPKVWTDYSVSKLALNAYSRLLARRLEARRARERQLLLPRVHAHGHDQGLGEAHRRRGGRRRGAARAAAAHRAPHGDLLQVAHAAVIL